MKHRKKWAGAAIAAFVALGMLGAVAPASAGSNHAARITINGRAAADRTFAAYKLADYTALSGDLATKGKWSFELDTVLGEDARAALVDYVEEQSTTPAYDDADQMLMDPLTWVATYWDNDPDDVWSDGTSVAPSVRALANELAANLTTYGLETPEQESASPLAVTEGLYLVIDTSAEAKGLTRSLPIIIGTQFMNGDNSPIVVTGGPSGQIDVKGDLVTLDKDILSNGLTNSADTLTASGNEPEDSWTTNVGGTVKFIIRTNVPMYTPSHVIPTFEVHDEWSAGLSAPIDTGIVVKAGTPTLEPVTDCTADTAQDGDQIAGNGYTYSFTEAVPAVEEQAEVKGTFVVTLCDPMAQRGNAVEITYSATVTEHGVDVGEYTWATNTAWVKFTNEWGTGDATEDETETDEVDIYTFKLQVAKSDLNDTSRPLDAEFTVYKADGVTVAGNGQTGITGSITFSGLAGNAWYQVKEMTPPAGYTNRNRDVAQFWVYVAANHNEDGATPKWYFTSAMVEDDGETLGVDEFQSFLAEGMSTIQSPYVRPTSEGDGSSVDMDVLVLNAKSASDMPSTGGQILLIVGLAGVLGLGGLTFGAVGLRKRKMTAATVQAA